ncbi:dTDP-4-dehydrorhamnose reductase [Flavobacteriaceae bacterium]|nr:dTDP-4-dehydrorhamnose reductase [Flavobacteriaceae bacterium]
MTKILVIGANGQLGQSFQYWGPHFPHFKMLFKDLPEFNLLDQYQLERYFQSTAIDMVINCAAYTAVDQAEDQPEEAQQLNATAINSLSELSKAYGFKLIHFSTDYVFDGSADTPYGEDDPLSPLGIYGKTKAEGEALMQSAGIDGWIIRTSWLFSPYGKNFVKTIFSLLQNKDEINVVANQTGSPTYAIDLAAATLKALDQKPAFDGIKVYHYTNSGHTTWYGLALTIQQKINTHCKIHAVDTATYATKAKRPKYSVLSCEKIKKDFNLNPQAWESALKDCLKKIG